MASKQFTRPSLEITGPSTEPRRHELDRPLVIGRSPEAGLHLPHPSVSRRHAELSVDAAQRWSVADLGSRNGTYVNGTSVRNHPLRSGDVLSVGEFSLRFVEDHRREDAIDVADVHVGNDAPGSVITALRNVQPPRLSADLISVVLEVGQRLAQIDDGEERLQHLIELIIGPAVGAWWCHALTVRRPVDGDRELQIGSLCAPANSSAGAAHEPHVSRTVLRAVLESGGPVIVNNLLPPTKFEAAMTIMPDAQKMAVVACPIDDVSRAAAVQAVRILYVTLPPLVASLEWLVVINLAVQQFRQVELSWAVRQADLARAALDREMAWARELQAHTLPRKQGRGRSAIDWALRFEPCLAVGGDYADVIWRRDGRVLIVMADVSGKGMRAALLASKVHTIFNADEGCSTLDDLVNAANRHLHRILPDASFVTLIAMLIDPATGEGTFINCGHPAPLMMNSRGEIRRLQCGDNYPLGLMVGEPIRSEQITLLPRDWVLFYTDGISEMANSNGQMLGSESFEAIVEEAYKNSAPQTAESFMSGIRDRLEVYRGTAAVTDDLTLLVCGLTPAADATEAPLSPPAK